MKNSTMRTGNLKSTTEESAMTQSLKVERKTAGAPRSLCWPLLISCCLSAVTLADVSLASEGLVPSAAARPMTGVELYKLYRDKSWAWSDGAGRFDDEARRFTARTGAGNTATWAKGRWTVTDDGRLCLDAQWHMVSGVHANKTCFAHRFERGTIYQRKEPSGAWYIFKHAVPTETDEFVKLTAEHLVSPDLATITTHLDDQKRLAGNTLPKVACRRKSQ
ncbi:DUF995 domain-containing protein [Pararhizobium sp. PWRC1-1]|uniref:DUF995 domain-containing protein n=1 Tax=Pararhizobium sp. PWRC1-1 TaxID=2804566 RepID=UPI003CF821F0